MQTTLDLSDSLYQRAKQAAALAGVSVEQFVATALEQQLRIPPARTIHSQRVQVPLVRSKQPGSRNLSADRVAEILDQDDAAA